MDRMRSKVSNPGHPLNPHISLPSESDITQSSTALQNIGPAATLAGCATLQGVNPASPAHRLDARTSARSSLARHEVGDVAVAR